MSLGACTATSPLISILHGEQQAGLQDWGATTQLLSSVYYGSNNGGRAVCGAPCGEGAWLPQSTKSQAYEQASQSTAAASTEAGARTRCISDRGILPGLLPPVGLAEIIAHTPKGSWGADNKLNAAECCPASGTQDVDQGGF